MSEDARDDLHLGAGPGGLRSAGRRTDQAFAARVGADRRRQHAGDRRDRAVEAEFAQHGEARQRVVRHRADRRHQAERDRQIVVAAFLRQVGGREIDGDAARRQREAGGDQRGAHALLGLGHRLVGQADDVEGRQAGRDLHLHVDRAGLDALERHRGDALDHGCPSTARVAVAGAKLLADKNICRTKQLELQCLSHFRGQLKTGGRTMIDLKTLEIELHHARLARIDAAGGRHRGRGADLAGRSTSSPASSAWCSWWTVGEPEPFGADCARQQPACRAV